MDTITHLVQTGHICVGGPLDGERRMCNGVAFAFSKSKPFPSIEEADYTSEDIEVDASLARPIYMMCTHTVPDNKGKWEPVHYWKWGSLSIAEAVKQVFERYGAVQHRIKEAPPITPVTDVRLQEAIDYWEPHATEGSNDYKQWKVIKAALAELSELRATRKDIRNEYS